MILRLAEDDKSTCQKSSKDTVSHVCQFPDNGTCYPQPPDWSTSDEYPPEGDESGVPDGYEMCLDGKGGSTLEFIMKDGNDKIGCTALTSEPRDIAEGAATVTCAPRPSGLKTCTGKGNEEKECIWIVHLDECWKPCEYCKALCSDTTCIPKRFECNKKCLWHFKAVRHAMDVYCKYPTCPCLKGEGNLPWTHNRTYELDAIAEEASMIQHRIERVASQVLVPAEVAKEPAQVSMGWHMRNRTCNTVRSHCDRLCRAIFTSGPSYFRCNTACTRHFYMGISSVFDFYCQNGVCESSGLWGPHMMGEARNEEELEARTLPISYPKNARRGPRENTMALL